MSLSKEQIISYHFESLKLMSNEDDSQIPIYFCHLSILRSLLNNEDYSNFSYQQKFLEFIKEILDCQYRDDQCDEDSEISFDEYLAKFLAMDEENAYGGNGSYDPYLLSLNYIRDILAKFIECCVAEREEPKELSLVDLENQKEFFVVARDDDENPLVFLESELEVAQYLIEHPGMCYEPENFLKVPSNSNVMICICVDGTCDFETGSLQELRESAAKYYREYDFGDPVVTRTEVTYLTTYIKYTISAVDDVDLCSFIIYIKE